MGRQGSPRNNYAQVGEIVTESQECMIARTARKGNINQLMMVGLIVILFVCSLGWCADGAIIETTEASGVVTMLSIEVLDQASDSLRYYSRLLSGALESYWSPPSVQPYAKFEADIALDVLRSGQTKNFRMSLPSQLEGFDLSIIDAIRRASPFPPIPPLMNKNELSLTIRFSLEVISQIDYARRLEDLRRTQKLKEAEEAEQAQRDTVRREEEEARRTKAEAQQQAEERKRQRRRAEKLATEERRKELDHQKEVQNNPQSYLPGRRLMCIGGKLDPICVGSKNSSSVEVGPPVTVQSLGPSTAIYGHYWRGLACRIYWADGIVKAIACE